MGIDVKIKHQTPMTMRDTTSFLSQIIYMWFICHTTIAVMHTLTQKSDHLSWHHLQTRQPQLQSDTTQQTNRPITPQQICYKQTPKTPILTETDAKRHIFIMISHNQNAQ